VIDARRWILAEAWLSLGLRIEWVPSYERDRIADDQWQRDDDGGQRFVYSGGGRWWVHDGTNRYGYGRPPLTAPSLSTDAMRHELAHWLTSTEDERGVMNFGAEPTGLDTTRAEERAIAAEPVLDAMLSACARIATMALGGRS
jgi:hypothetical protein